MIGVAQERMESLIRQLLRELLPYRTTITRFVLVGGSGYLLYQGVLFLVYDSALFWFLPAKDTSADIILFEHGDVRLLITTLVATSLALVVVFTGHNLWTFRDRDSVRKPLWMRFGQFVATVSIGSGIIITTVNVLAVRFDMYHFIALPIGTALAGIWDWLLYSRFVWRKAKKRRLEE